MKKWKYLVSIMISCIFILGIFSVNNKIDNEIILNAQSTNDREFKAVWVTPLVGDVSLNGEDTFKTNMTEVLNIMEHYGLNALMFHVRTHNNALYPSEINPKATYISNIDFNRFDPISWLIEESHKRGIEFHAWMNPYRYSTSYQTGTMPSSNPQSNLGNTLEGRILNPALANVKEHIYKTINEFVNRYPTVDSIHFDDYFYVETSASPTGDNDRRAHVDELIEGIYNRLKTFNLNNNSYVQFGISPTGIYKNGNGTVTYDSNGMPITNGSNTKGQAHYGSYLYADTLKWIKEGWLDYIVPQVYWARDLSAAPFLNVLSWWDKVVKYLDVNLYTGIGLYKALESGGAGWYTDSNEMNAQFNIIENDLENVLGYSIYSFKHLKMAYNGDTARVGQQVKNAYNDPKRKSIKVLPEIKSMTPVIPEAVSSTHNNGTITWNSVDDAKFYYIYSSSGDLTYSSDEIIGVVGNNPGVNSFSISNYNSSYNYGIRALSRTNHLSPVSTTPPLEVYNITYDLGGGVFDTNLYVKREDMITDFLTDFYNFLNPEVDLNTFMHGPGKTSGFDGLYDGDYFSELFNINDKSVNSSTNKFINQPEYNKWVPLLDLMDEYTNKGLPPQTFWGSKYTAQRRIKPFILQENLWEEDGEPKASTIMEIVNRIPAFNGSENSVYYQYTKNFPDIVLPNAIKEGYRFLGWYTSSFGGSRVTTIFSGSTGNMTFYARWEVIHEEIEEVLVTFNLDYDNKYLSEQTVEKGSLVLAPADPYREHYAFLGWYVNGQKFDFNMPANNNLNLVAKWSFSSFIVRFFDYNGSILKQEIVTPGSNATAPTNPTRVGHTFTGWSTSYRNVISDLDVYAEYATAKYFVEFVHSDGQTIDSYLVDYGTKITEIAGPTKDGLTFLGWYANDELFDFDTPITEDIVLIAWYDTLRYSVTFLNEDGSVFAVQSVEESQRAARPQTNPFRDGYTFNSWIINDSPYNFNDPVNNDITLLPSWDILVHTIKFLNYDLTEIGTSYVNHGSSAVRPTNPLRYGYTFNNWYLGDVPYEFKGAVYEDLTLIANWNINSYTVRFLDFDGVILSEQTIAHGSGAIAPSSPNNKEGHVFAGWSRNYNNIVSYTEVVALYNPYNMFVEFVNEDGTHINTIEVPYGTKAINLVGPYKEGYVFAGWVKDGVLFDFDSLIYEDLILTASYELGGYLVTFLNYDGQVFIRQNVLDGDTVNKPTSNPQREGYSFAGWTLNDSPYNFNNPVYNDITLMPTWEILVHTVSFYIDDELYDSVFVNHGTNVNKIEDPIKAGYKFTGWYLGDYIYEFTGSVYEDLNLYAKWEVVYYKVNFLDYDGTVLKEINNVLYGANVTPPNNPDNKVGHYFSSWDKNYTNIIEDTNITAVYEKLKYFVEFYNYNNEPHESILVPYEQTVTPPTAPTRVGYTFTGWVTKAGELFNFESLITTNIELYPSYEIKTYKITFLDSSDVFLELVLDYGEALNKPTEEPTRVGYAFTGWYLDGRLYNFEESYIIRDITLTSGWKVNSYTVTFLNEDNSIFNVVTVEAGKTLNEPKEKPIKEGYSFDSWLLNNIVYPFDWPVNSDLKLKASFTVNKYNVNFIVAKEIVSSHLVEHGDNITEPINPEKEGYTFMGWYLGDSLYNFLFPIYEPIDLVASWSINTYRVRFFAGQTLLKEEYVEYLNSATPPTAPTRVGYRFTGWDKSYDNIVENIELSALYEVSMYSVTFKDNENIILTTSVAHGTDAVAPKDVEKVGYNFIGWDKSFSNVTENIEVNAIYEKIELTVRYYDYYDNIIKEEVVFYNDYLSPPEAAVIEGATFNCWLLDALVQYDVSKKTTNDLELYAFYDVFVYQVNFYSYDDKLLKTEEVVHGNPATAPTLEAREGYVFAGWDQDFSVIKDNVNIYPRYIKEDANTFTVRFVNDDESLIKEELVNENETLIEPNAPTKVGYTFVGWLKDGVVFNFNNPITKDLTLKASYEANIYQVVYRDRDVIATIDAVYDSTIIVPEVPARLGYNGAWELDLTNIKIKRDYIINAVYTLIDYKITYHNIRSGINNNPLTHTIMDVVMLKDLEDVEGFVGWYDEFDSEVLVLSGFGDKVLYAKWEVNEYVVNFIDYNGKTISTQIVKYGNSATAPTVEPRAHYKHIGWDNSFTNIRGDLTVKALYVGNEYNLSFQTNSQTVIKEQKIIYPNLAIKPENPTKEGFDFVGWYKDSSYNNLFNFNEPISEDTTIYAKYNIKTYIVTFVDDSGNVIEQVSVAYNGKASPTKTVIKEHYNHVGWDKPLTNIVENTTITAIFEPKDYKVTFFTDGGLYVSEQVCSYPEFAEVPNTPTKEGFDFVGWYTNEDYTTRFNFFKPITEDTTIYARWLESLDDNLYISMYQGASIRYKTESSSQGLRFSARINEDFKNNKHGFYLVYGETTVEDLRVAINNKNGDEDLMINGKIVYKVEVAGVDLNNSFSVVLTGIPKRGYTDELSAIGYVVVDGEQQFTELAATRSVLEVTFNSFNNGISNESLTNIKNEVNDKVVLSTNVFGDIELNNTFFEYNHKYLKAEFNKDFNELFNKDYDDLNVLENDLMSFYSNQSKKEKWMFMLDYFLSLSVNSNLNKQIENIKILKENESLTELVYAFNNFFNEENEKIDEQIIDFSNLENYLELKNFNNKIYINLKNYYLYTVGQEITLMGVIENIPGYVFDHYLIAGIKYKPMDVYKVTNECVTFEKVYIKTDFKVTFMEDGAFYYEEFVEPYKTLSSLPTIYKSGYKFLGWYNSIGALYSENTKIIENTTLYAKFEKINYINNISINIDKETYKVISKSENINVEIYYDYNYVDVIIKPNNDYQFYHDIIIEIYFNGDIGKIISFNVNEDEINYTLDDPNYTNRY